MSGTDKKLDKKRVIVAILLLAWILGGLYFGGILLALFLALFIFVGTKEFVGIAEKQGMHLPFSYIVTANFFMLTLASLKLYNFLFGSFVFFASVAFLIILFRGAEAKINDLSSSLLGLVYTGIFPLHIVMIRDLNDTTFSILGQEHNIGIGLVMMLFLIVAACDIGAFYSGKLFGKNPLWKEVSPKKTIEGSTGGTLAGILIALIAGYFIGLNSIESIISGIIVSMAAQLGDLIESMIKREAGVKDSGNLFPGHGGVLDRSDSYIFTVVAGYYFFKHFVVQDFSAVFSTIMF